jgi:DNA-directed RNA polymerase omega subunit
MGYQPLEQLLPKSGNSVYKLVRMASQRATEIADGQPKLIEIPFETKTATVALEEIRSGKVLLRDAAQESFVVTEAEKNKEKQDKVAQNVGS